MIEPINPHYSFENPATVYDEDAMTALKLAGRTAAKVNEVVKDQNRLDQETTEHLQQQDQNIDKRMDAQDAAITKMNTETMPAKVTAEVQRKIDSGEFDQAINRYAGNLEERVDTLLSNVPEGSTTMDAEVIDIRTLEMEQHETAGNAVRSVDKRTNALIKRADGGFVCFAPTDVSKVGGWTAPGAAKPACVAVGADSLTWYYSPDFTISDPGVSIPIENKVAGAEYIYIEFDMLKDSNNNSVSVWFSSKDGFTSGQCKQYTKLVNSTNFRAALRVLDFDFEINKMWIIVHSDEDDGYLNLWVKVSNINIYTNTLKDAGFRGKTVDSHLLELRDIATDDTIGTTVIAKTGDEIYKPWAGATGTTESVANNVTGDFGLGYYFGGKVDPAKLLHIEFDLETDHNNFDLYIGSGKSLGSSYSTLKHITAGGHYAFDIDPAYYSVYVGFDVASIFLLSHSADTAVNWTLSNFRVYQNAILDVGGVEKLEDNIVRLYQKETAPAAEVDTTLIAPDGNRFFMQVNNAGGVVAVPIVPRKTLYVGNSLLTGFGHGMAASAPDKDYYYLLNSAFAATRPTHTASKISGAAWEGLTTLASKSEWCENTLAPKLTADLDLVIVQLGDNVNTDEKKAVLHEGVVDLLRFIRSCCPAARVAWVGVWYGAANIEAIQTACNKTGCMFINILDLHTKENENAVGNTWTDANGNVTEITSSGVASHPGDAGFKAIANRALYKLGVTDNESYYT